MWPETESVSEELIQEIDDLLAKLDRSGTYYLIRRAMDSLELMDMRDAD